MIISGLFQNLFCLGQFNGDSTSYGQGGTPSDQQFYNEELIKETLILLYTQVIHSEII